MLFKESDLAQDVNLDQYMHLTEQESKMNISTIPVLENSRIGIHTVDFDNVQKIAEDYGCDYLTAINSIQESNKLDSVAVAVDESTIIEDASIINELENVIIKPQSENSTAYQFCEEMANAYLESGDEQYLDAIVLDEGIVDSAKNAINNIKDSDTYKTARQYNPKNFVINYKFVKLFGKDKSTADNVKMAYRANPKAGKTAAAVAGLGAVSVGLLGKKVYDYRKAIQMANNKPKSWISQKIASLRGIYAKWLEAAKKESDANKANVIKKAAASLLKIIDQLLAKMQKLSDRH